MHPMTLLLILSTVNTYTFFIENLFLFCFTFKQIEQICFNNNMICSFKVLVTFLLQKRKLVMKYFMLIFSKKQLTLIRIIR